MPGADRRLVLCVDSDRDGYPLPDHVRAERWAYCDWCGTTWPAFGGPYVICTRDEAYNRLMPRFLDHRCPGGGP